MQEVLYRIYQILTYVDIVAFFVLTALLLFSFNRLTTTLKWFTVFEFLVFVIVLVALIMAKMAIPNTILFHSVFFAQLLWLVIYYQQLFKQTKAANVIAGVGAVCLAWAIVKYTTDWDEIKGQLGGQLYFMSNLLFIGFSIVYYVYTLTGLAKLNHPLINAAVLIYFSGTSVIFLFGDYLLKIDTGVQAMIWILNVLLHIIFVLLIFVDIWRTLYPGKRIL